MDHGFFFLGNYGPWFCQQKNKYIMDYLILIIYKHGTTNSKNISSNPMCHNSKPPSIF